MVLTLSLIIHQYDSIDHLSNCSIDRSAGTREHSDHFIRTFHGTVTSASKIIIRRFVITEKAPSRAFSWLKAATTTFAFKTLLRHYAKRALTPRSLNVKLGPRRKGHMGRVVWLA